MEECELGGGCMVAGKPWEGQLDLLVKGNFKMVLTGLV